MTPTVRFLLSCDLSARTDTTLDKLSVGFSSHWHNTGKLSVGFSAQWHNTGKLSMGFSAHWHDTGPAFRGFQRTLTWHWKAFHGFQRALTQHWTSFPWVSARTHTTLDKLTMGYLHGSVWDTISVIQMYKEIQHAYTENNVSYVIKRNLTFWQGGLLQ